MNSNEYILAFADIPDDLIRSASDDEAVRKVFRQHRSRRNKMIGALCCCIVVAVAAVGIGSQNWFRKTPALIPGEPTNADHQTPGQTQKQPTETQPGITPSETVSASESTEKPDSKKENSKEQQLTNDSDRQEPTTKAPTQTPSDDTSVIWGEQGGVSSSSYAYVLWNGKRIDYELWKILQKDTAGKTIAIIASPIINAQFVYNGKTIAEYEAEFSEESELPNKLQQLLKEGDLLKYGEALYTTGAPNGERWDKGFYEQRIAYYGTEMLSKYIVNGVFFADQVAMDLPLAQNATAAREAYDDAASAFYSQTVAAAASSFSAAGLSCSVMESGNALLLFASSDRFAGLTAPGNAEWYFSLAQKNLGDTVTSE